MEKDFIVVGFSRPNKSKKFPIFSWLIRLVEGTKFSHTYIKGYQGLKPQGYVYQASGLDVNFMGLEIFESNVEILHEYKIEVTRDQRRDMISRAIRLSGSPYGIKQIFGIAYHRFGRLFGQNWRNPFSDGEITAVCSEIVAAVLINLGFEFKQDLDLITPRDIHDALEKGIKLGLPIERFI